MDQGTIYMGIDVSATTVKAALVNADGEIYEITQEAIGDDPDAVLDGICRSIERLRERANERHWSIRCVGVGLPGLVNAQTQRVEAAPNLPALVKLNVAEAVAEKVRCPVLIENDANMAAYGEFVCGAARGRAHVIYIAIGTGIGAGLIYEGRLYRGALGFAGEFGHTTVDPDGLPCRCGNRGCLETIASGPNIVRRARERLFRDRSSSLSRLAVPGKGELTPERIAAEALNGDDFSLMILEQTGKWIGIAVANVLNLLNLDMVVLGGGVMVAGELLLNPIIAEVKRRAFTAMVAHCDIVASLLGGQAGVIGSAMLARDTFR
ncbi:MAG: ROK family protein [Blastocatellia bacterium]|nr:ROK family protein [Blastocatellia bacterium]MCS7156159.1 ROK family protein [Blastocatellia bacterium]MCX7751490.1 ROK family protein [Blastocatellia bacterium]MDW8169203.1 ROK family protein [Acidobacteriota bacterium]MDW8256064.1 ROK family protein [Acidobacteriota bacterium]